MISHTHRQSQGGPPLALVAGISTALFVASVIAGTAIAGDSVPAVTASQQTVVSFFREHHDAVEVMAFLQFASAVPLIMYAATVSARLRNLGIRAPGVNIGFAGGIGAATFLSLSACIAWVSSRDGIFAEPALIRALHDLWFITSGPANVVAFGLLLAGISVPAAFGRLLPRRIVVVGLVLAVVAEVSSLTLIVDGAAFLLPIARFGGLAWLIVAGVLLPKTRATTADDAGDRAAHQAARPA